MGAVVVVVAVEGGLLSVSFVRFASVYLDFSAEVVGNDL